MLGHGTDYFTSPPKEGMLRESEASMLTTRPPKPLRDRERRPVRREEIMIVTIRE
jgi:hypothetical protein